MVEATSQQDTRNSLLSKGKERYLSLSLFLPSIRARKVTFEQTNMTHVTSQWPLLQVDRFSSAYRTWWPPWVYKMYDAVSARKIVRSRLQNPGLNHQLCSLLLSKFFSIRTAFATRKNTQISLKEKFGEKGFFAQSFHCCRKSWCVKFRRSWRAGMTLWTRTSFLRTRPISRTGWLETCPWMTDSSFTWWR